MNRKKRKEKSFNTFSEELKLEMKREQRNIVFPLPIYEAQEEEGQSFKDFFDSKDTDALEEYLEQIGQINYSRVYLLDQFITKEELAQFINGYLILTDYHFEDIKCVFFHEGEDDRYTLYLNGELECSFNRFEIHQLKLDSKRENNPNRELFLTQLKELNCSGEILLKTFFLFFPQIFQHVKIPKLNLLPS